MGIYKPKTNSSGEDNGQVTVIGGSSLFHGAPILSLKAASRLVDMVFFASPEESVGRVAEKIKSKLNSFIWVPWSDVNEYIEKSDACLIGPGMMREKKTYEITEKLLRKYSDKKWLIDAGSLQMMKTDWIPENAILTPNKKEFEILFNVKCQISNIKSMSKKYKCIIVAKGPETIVCSPESVRL
jgi:NAD(P)H-hydrate epimerase